MYHNERNTTLFDSERMSKVAALNERMMADQPERFARAGQTASIKDYDPGHTFKGKQLHGDLDGPNGEIWFYQGVIECDSVVHNEYWTEVLPKGFSVDIYDNDMKLRGSIRHTIKLKEHELRVRLIELLPVITRHYYNQDDKLEITVGLYVNHKYEYGAWPYTYVFSLGDEPDENGEHQPVMVMEKIVSDVLDASDENGENFLMTYVREYNDSGLTEDDIDFMGTTEEGRKNFWAYNEGNKVEIEVMSKADAEGNMQSVFKTSHVYYQSQGNQEDDPLMVTKLHDGKAVIVYPHYKKIFYNPFYSVIDEMTQAADNELVIDIYEQPAVGQPFVLTQSTSIPAVKVGDESVLFSYYAVGSFLYKDDIAFNGDHADFIITRRDYQPSSDSSRQSFAIYNADGTMRRAIVENADGYMGLSNLKGFDPMEVFFERTSTTYIFHFMNLRTFDIELSLDYGLMLDGPDGEPDHIMANIDRTLSADGSTFYYVAEMRVPGYDDINDVNYMRAVWLNRDGSFHHMDQINMGNNVNYAQLYIDSAVLRPDFYYSDDKMEYMMLIKRARPGGGSEEQLLIGQVADKANPLGKDILLLGDSADGPLSNIYVMPGAKNLLYVTYGYAATDTRTTHIYRLPLDIEVSGLDKVESAAANIAFDGSTLTADGEIAVYSMQGILVGTAAGSYDLTALPAGVYIARAGNAAIKVAVK